MTQPRAIILSFLSLATSEASSWHEPQATRLPCVSHKECVAERGVTHLQPAETWRHAFQVILLPGNHRDFSPPAAAHPCSWLPALQPAAVKLATNKKTHANCRRQ